MRSAGLREGKGTAIQSPESGERKMTQHIVKAVFLRAKAGKEEEVERRLDALAVSARSEPGVITFDLHRSPTEAASWFLYERYESQEHFNKHLENPVLRSFRADAATLLDGSLDVHTFTVIELISPRLKAAG